VRVNICAEKRAVFIFLLVQSCMFSAILSAQEEGNADPRTAKLSDTPAALEPEITFIARAPEIDGRLDSALKSLPVREFTHVWRGDVENPLPRSTFRLAYGTDFLYVYVESEGQQLTFRDRAYQNGDGFIMVIAAPRPDNEPAEEFYVLACSAVNQPRMEWSRRIFWYYNVDKIFIPTSEDTKLEFQAAEGKISFELFLPWKDVHPYHPWISESIGFNLAFVKAVGESTNYYFLVSDMSIDAEYHTRQYCPARFQEPQLTAGSQTFFLLERNNIQEGQVPSAMTVTVAAEPGPEEIVVTIESGEGDRIGRDRQGYECGKGLSVRELPLDSFSNIPNGGYRIRWASGVNNSKGECGLTILPGIEPEAVKARLAGLCGKLPPDSVATLRFLFEEILQQLEKTKPYETCGVQRIRLDRLLKNLEAAEQGEDVYAGGTGVVRKAYRSRLDDTLQPYCVVVPDNYDPNRRYPLIVYLHGSASDETNIAGARQIVPEGFIGLGPKGRGPSNAYSVDNAQDDIAEAIEAVCRTYPIDTDKIFLSGFSMGGYGVYRTFYETPDKFKALIVIAGHPDIANRYFPGGGHPNFFDEKYLEPFKGVPVFIFHGKKDRNCPYELTQQLVETLRAAGALVEFQTDEERGHEPPGETTLAKYRQWIKEVLDDEDQK
jgi:predicted esterase